MINWITLALMHTPIPLKHRIGIIDLGSNSARLMVVHYAPGEAFRITDEISRRVRLSESMAGEGGRLQPAAIARALETIQMFRAFCSANDIRHIVPVATAAVRDAVNAAEFLAKVEATTALKFRVLTGEEEAYFGTLGVINSVGLREGLVIDIGGGSAEVSEVRRGKFKRGITVPLGAVRLTEIYLNSDPVRPTEVVRLNDHLSTTFKLLEWMKLKGDGGQVGEHFVGIGGTVRALAKIDREERGYPLGLVHGYELSLSRLERLGHRLGAMSVRERAQKISGLRGDRADIILAGAMTVAAALRQAGADHLVVGGHGLREGLFFQSFLKPADPPVVRNLREFSALNLARLYGYEAGHVSHVAKLSLSLFDQLVRQHGYSALERGYLWAAAQLHDIGTVVDYYDHHKHSAYIILNAGLPGYTHREVTIIALLCLYHRKGKPSLAPYERLLSEGDDKLVSRLAALLRLAEYLDRSRTQAVSQLKLIVSGKRARLLVQTRSPAVGRVEIWEAQRSADLFEEAFGLRLTIEAE
jgi:exopolyphosphatase/guanosine-5'-triphosphate,3'-diphosphate pyrophosphatase